MWVNECTRVLVLGSRCPRTCAGSPPSCPSTWRNVSLPWRRTRVAESTSSGWSRCVHWCAHGVCIAWRVHGLWTGACPVRPLATSQPISPQVVPSAHPLRTPYSRVSLRTLLLFRVPSLTDDHQESDLKNRVTRYWLSKIECHAASLCSSTTRREASKRELPIPINDYNLKMCYLYSIFDGSYIYGSWCLQTASIKHVQAVHAPLSLRT